MQLFHSCHFFSDYFTFVLLFKHLSFKLLGIHIEVFLLFLFWSTFPTAAAAAAEATAAGEEHGTEKKCLKRQGTEKQILKKVTLLKYFFNVKN